MNFVTAVKTCFRKYFDFTGRARRSEFWWFFVFIVAMGFALSAIDAYVFPHPGNRFWITGDAQIHILNMGISEFRESPLRETFGWLTFIPLSAATVRRLHDRGASLAWFVVPWATLIGFYLSAGWLLKVIPKFLSQGLILVPICAFIFILTAIIKMFKDSEKAANEYGQVQNTAWPTPRCKVFSKKSF